MISLPALELMLNQLIAPRIRFLLFYSLILWRIFGEIIFSIIYCKILYIFQNPLAVSFLVFAFDQNTSCAGSETQVQR